MNTVKIKINPVLKALNPLMVLGIIEGKVINSAYNKELWDEIQQITLQIRSSFTFETIKNQPQIAATRKLYSVCGKDPSRYRPSAEALMRRIVKNQELYQINTVVDIINLVSLKSGYSIGAFDASLIEGPVEAGLGKADEIYNAIGRGLLNIENLPVCRDSKGPIGSPTSDEERTAIRNVTKHLLMILYACDGPGSLAEVMEYAMELLGKYAMATILKHEII